MRRSSATAVRPDAVLKVGGSLCARPPALRRLITALRSLAGRRTLVLVPGGGRFADEVRRADRRFRLDASSAHWMAILAMDQTAHLLAHLAGNAVLARTPGELRPGRLNVLAPSVWLRRTDRLPHSWAVTSDSIAAWVARVLRAKRLVLLKDVDGVFDRHPAASARARLRRRVARHRLGGVVDPYFTRALGPARSCWILNGSRPERVVALLETGSAYGTEVTSTPRGWTAPRGRRGAPAPAGRRVRG